MSDEYGSIENIVFAYMTNILRNLGLSQVEGIPGCMALTTTRGRFVFSVNILLHYPSFWRFEWPDGFDDEWFHGILAIWVSQWVRQEHWDNYRRYPDHWEIFDTVALEIIIGGLSRF